MPCITYAWHTTFNNFITDALMKLRMCLQRLRIIRENRDDQKSNIYFRQQAAMYWQPFKGRNIVWLENCPILQLFFTPRSEQNGRKWSWIDAISPVSKRGFKSSHTTEGGEWHIKDEINIQRSKWVEILQWDRPKRTRGVTHSKKVESRCERLLRTRQRSSSAEQPEGNDRHVL